MSPAQLKERWARLEKSAPPNVPAPLLRRLLAQRLQERRFGALPAVVAHELERLARGDTAPPLKSSPPPLTPGARLVREWNGRTICVEVREEGFWWQDRTWRSLSEIAREVTGARWSGPRFFGLQHRG